jgi:hypothetical protein
MTSRVMFKRSAMAYSEEMGQLSNVARLVAGSFVVYIVVACTAHVVNAPKGDQTPPATADSSSGTRLKAKRYVTDDGAKQFVNWYDTLQKTDCTLQPTDDPNTIRCFPPSVEAHYFSDSACTMPLAQAPGGTTYVSRRKAGAVDPTFYAIGGDYSGPSFFVSGALADGPCMPTSTIPGPPPTGLKSAGPAIDPTTFAAATIQTDP